MKKQRLSSSIPELVLPKTSDRIIANKAFEKPSLTGTSAGELSDITIRSDTDPDLEKDLTAWHREKVWGGKGEKNTVAVFPLALGVEPAKRTDWNDRGR